MMLPLQLPSFNYESTQREQVEPVQVAQLLEHCWKEDAASKQAINSSS
jgi:hypothetical protein